MRDISDFEYVEAEAIIIAHLVDQEADVGSFLPQIQEIPGQDRQENIWSIIYYNSEAQFSVINQWFTPQRFFRAGDAFTCKIEHLALLPVIVEARRSIDKLLLKHLRVKKNETLWDFDKVLDAFFSQTGYKQVEDVSIAVNRLLANK